MHFNTGTLIEKDLVNWIERFEQHLSGCTEAIVTDYYLKEFLKQFGSFPLLIPFLERSYPRDFFPKLDDNIQLRNNISSCKLIDYIFNFELHFRDVENIPLSDNALKAFVNDYKDHPLVLKFANRIMSNLLDVDSNLLNEQKNTSVASISK